MKPASSAMPRLFRRLRAQRAAARCWRRARDEKRLRIWSAACAAGQEAYSIAMMLDGLGLAREGWSIELIATDISGEAIARAEARPLLLLRNPARPLRRRSGGAVSAPSGRLWRGRASAPHGDVPPLQSAGFLWLAGRSGHGVLPQCADLFRQRHQGSVLERIADTMAPDGVLVLGETETASRWPDLFSECARRRWHLRQGQGCRAAPVRGGLGESVRSVVPAPGSGARSGSPISATSKWKVCSRANSPASAACSTWSV